MNNCFKILVVLMFINSSSNCIEKSFITELTYKKYSNCCNWLSCRKISPNDFGIVGSYEEGDFDFIFKDSRYASINDNDGLIKIIIRNKSGEILYLVDLGFFGSIDYFGFSENLKYLMIQKKSGETYIFELDKMEYL